MLGRSFDSAIFKTSAAIDINQLLHELPLISLALAVIGLHQHLLC